MKAIQRELLVAVRNDDLIALDNLLTAAAANGYTDAIQGSYPDGRNLLHFAVTWGSKECLEELLTAGVNPDAQDVNCRTPLHVAVKYQRHDIIPKLLAKCSNPNTQDFHFVRGEDKPLADAIAEGEIDYGNTPLLTAVRNKDVEGVRLLLQDSRLDVNVVDKLGLMPLHAALQTDLKADSLFEMVEMLLNAGARPNEPAKNSELMNVAAFHNDKERPLHLAVKAGLEDITRLLIERGADPNGLTASKCSPLHVATKIGKEDAVNALVNYGADFGIQYNVKDNDQNTPLHYAAENGLNHGVALLLRGPASPDEPGAYNRTPLMLAAKGGHWDCLMQLVKTWSFDVNRQDYRGLTALHMATKTGSQECIASLLNVGAELEAKDNLGMTPLCTALYQTAEHRQQDFNCMNYLVRRGADVNSKEKYGRSMLHAVADNDDFWPEHMQWLLGAGADPNVRDDYGETPLTLAISKNRNYHVSELLAFGADPDMPGPWGIKPITLAIRQGNTHIVRCLIEAGEAGVSIKGAKKAVSQSNLSEKVKKDMKALLSQYTTKDNPEMSDGIAPAAKSAGTISEPGNSGEVHVSTV